jgi:cell division protein FtsW (lipid II flippase)
MHLIYLLIIYRGFRIAIEATEPFQQLLAAGLTSIFAIQTWIIAAGNMKLMPQMGIPLPFLSADGSSLFANFIIISILLRISYNTAQHCEGAARVQRRMRDGSDKLHSCPVDNFASPRLLL